MFMRAFHKMMSLTGHSVFKRHDSSSKEDGDEDLGGFMATQPEKVVSQEGAVPDVSAFIDIATPDDDNAVKEGNMGEKRRGILLSNKFEIFLMAITLICVQFLFVATFFVLLDSDLNVMFWNDAIIPTTAILICAFVFIIWKGRGLGIRN